MFRIGILSACSALALAGCQTRPLAITEFKTGGEGAPYALRFTQYEVKVKWRVTSCGRRAPLPGESRDSRQRIKDEPFTLVAEVSAEPSFPDDLSKRWLLDLGSLDSWINTTDLEVTYENGRFKSFNAKVDDRTVETVTAIASAVAKVGAIALALHDPRSEAFDACADMVFAARTATADVETKTKALARARLELLAREAQGASRRDIRRAEAAVSEAVMRLQSATETLDAALKKVTFEEKLRWPLTGTETSLSQRLPDAAVEQWQARRWQTDRISVNFELRVFNAGGGLEAPPREPQTLDAMIDRGRIPVRVARPGALVATLDVDGKQSEVLRKESAIIQSGDVIYVPVEYRWPRSSAAGFGLDANGYLSTVSRKQTSAPAETIGNAVQGAAEQLGPLFPSELDKLKAENDELGARKTNAELRKALAPQSEAALELEALQGELALKKARLELLQTDAALKALDAS